jgi:hypothetical protein
MLSPQHEINIHEQDVNVIIYSSQKILHKNSNHFKATILHQNVSRRAIEEDS